MFLLNLKNCSWIRSEAVCAVKLRLWFMILKNWLAEQQRPRVGQIVAESSALVINSVQLIWLLWSFIIRWLIFQRRRPADSITGQRFMLATDTRAASSEPIINFSFLAARLTICSLEFPKIHLKNVLVKKEENSFSHFQARFSSRQEGTTAAHRRRAVSLWRSLSFVFSIFFMTHISTRHCTQSKGWIRNFFVPFGPANPRRVA